jgi:hypothetical protein
VGQLAGKREDIPPPKVLVFEAGVSLIEIEARVLREEYPRLVIHVKAEGVYEADTLVQERISRWADDSVGYYDAYPVESNRYNTLPHFINRKTPDFLAVRKSVGACRNIFIPYRGNRSCFEVCDEPNLYR